MIKIDFLKNYPQAIPAISKIWHEVLGQVWMPEIGIEEIESLYYHELNDNLPLGYVALDNNTPVGSCSLHLHDSIRPNLGPWLSDLIVDPKYQNQGIGKMLIDASKIKIAELGFSKLYLFTFDSNVAYYYSRLNWKKIDLDEFHSHPIIIMEINL